MAYPRQEMIMSNLVDLAQGFELRDASGRTFVFHPDPVVRELRSECQRLREQLAKVQAERDEYRQALDAIVEGAPVITRAELEDLEKNGIPGEQVLEEVERLLRERDNV
jgi:hypothetical protein